MKRTDSFLSTVVTLALAIAFLAVGCPPKEGTGPGPTGPGGGGPGVGGPVETGPTALPGHRPRAKKVAIKATAKDRFEKVIAKHEGLRREGKVKEACDRLIRDYEKVLKEDANLWQAAYNIAIVYIECGDFDRARSTASDMMMRYAKQAPWFKAALGYLAHAKGDTGGALRLYRDAIKDAPWITLAHNNLARILLDDYVRKMVTYERTKDKDLKVEAKKGLLEAIGSVRRALVYEPDNIASYERFALLYYHADYYRLAGLVCELATKIEGKPASALAPIFNIQGLLALKRRPPDVTGALAYFKEAATRDPNYVPALLNWGAITISFRDYETSLAKFKKVIELDPGNYAAYLTMGVALRGLERYAEAEAAYKKAAEIRPRAGEPWFNLGVLYQEHMKGGTDLSAVTRNYRTAIGFYRKFLGLSDDEKMKKDVEKRVAQLEKNIADMSRMSAPAGK